MEAVTLLVASAASAAVFILAPIRGLIIYVAVLAWYPSYLTVRWGTLDFTVSRIVIIAIYANLFLRTGLPSRFKFIWLDKLVTIYFMAQLFSGFMTRSSLLPFLENRAGAIFDMVLPYFAVRMVVTTKKEYLKLLKGIVLIASPLAIAGFYQCLTGHNPARFLRKYHAWKRGYKYQPILRAGFFRAEVTFPMSIMFGLFFAMLGPAYVGVLGSVRKNKWMHHIGIGLMAVGVFSSISSGPWLAALLAVLAIGFYRYRRYWKVAAAIILLGCGIVEFTSNRHFYDVLGSFTLTPRTAWYRSKLIEVVVLRGGMSGHWITGYGNTDPGWGQKIDGRPVDIVNHYLLVLAIYGLVGLLPFLAIIAAAFKKLVEAFRASLTDSNRWLIWCLSGALAGILGAMFSVSLFGQPTTVFYMLMGFCGAMPQIIRNSPRTNIPATLAGAKFG